MSSGTVLGGRHSSSGWRIPRPPRREAPVIPVSERDLEEVWRLRFRDPLVEGAFREEQRALKPFQPGLFDDLPES